MNKVMINGRLTKDVDLRFTQEGKAIGRFTIAVNRNYQKGEVDFINCTAFGKSAETITQYFSKGKPINIEGNLRTGSYDKDGEKRYITAVNVERFEFPLSSKQENNALSDMQPIDGDGDIPF